MKCRFKFIWIMNPGVEWSHNEVGGGGGSNFCLGNKFDFLKNSNYIICGTCITYMRVSWHLLILTCYTLALGQFLAAQGVQSLTYVYIYMHSWSSWELQCQVCMKSSSYRRDSMLSIRLSEKKNWKPFYKGSVLTLFRYFVYVSLKLIFSWLSLRRLAMWAMGFLF